MVVKERTRRPWFVRPPGRAPFGPLDEAILVEGFLTGGIAPGSYVCPQGDNTWLPAADVPSFRRVIKSASVPTLRPVELSFDDETPTQLRVTRAPQPLPLLAFAPAPSPPRAPVAEPVRVEDPPIAPPDPTLPPLPVVPSLSSAPPPVSASGAPSARRQPSFLSAALVSAALGGVLGACAWLVHDGMRDEAPAVAPVAQRIETPAQPRETRPQRGAGPTSDAPSAELARVPSHHLCRSAEREPTRLCRWVTDLAAGRPAERIGLVELQRLLADRDVFQAELAVLGSADDQGRLPVRLFGDYGYCFHSARPARNEPRLVAWVQRRPGTVRGRHRACVILDEVPFAERLIELSRRQGDADAPVIARKILEELSLPTESD